MSTQKSILDPHILKGHGGNMEKLLSGIAKQCAGCKVNLTDNETRKAKKKAVTER